jgi:L-asparaginase II
MSLFHSAWGWARLVDPVELNPGIAEACYIITTAMMKNPFYVAGPGRLDTWLMEIAGGRVCSKAGAEAFHSLGILPDQQNPRSGGLGISIKIADGDLGRRAKNAVILEVLRQLKILLPDQLKQLSAYGPQTEIKNHCQLVIGESKPCFELQYS